MSGLVAVWRYENGMYDREDLNEFLNILDGNLSFLVIADNEKSLTDAYSDALKALTGVYSCRLELLDARRRGEL